jgi:hypothetical protein
MITAPATIMLIAAPINPGTNRGQAELDDAVDELAGWEDVVVAACVAVVAADEVDGCEREV